MIAYAARELEVARTTPKLSREVVERQVRQIAGDGLVTVIDEDVDATRGCDGVFESVADGAFVEIVELDGMVPLRIR